MKKVETLSIYDILKWLSIYINDEFINQTKVNFGGNIHVSEMGKTRR